MFFLSHNFISFTYLFEFTSENHEKIEYIISFVFYVNEVTSTNGNITYCLWKMISNNRWNILWVLSKRNHTLVFFTKHEFLWGRAQIYKNQKKKKAVISQTKILEIMSLLTASESDPLSNPATEWDIPPWLKNFTKRVEWFMKKWLSERIYLCFQA